MEEEAPSSWERFFAIVLIFTFLGPFFWAIGGIPIALFSAMWSGDRGLSLTDLPFLLAVVLLLAYAVDFPVALGTGVVFGIMAICFRRASYLDAGLAALIAQAALRGGAFGRSADMAATASIFVSSLVAACVCRRLSRRWAAPA
jgi:hypothetical protein